MATSGSAHIPLCSQNNCILSAHQLLFWVQAAFFPVTSLIVTMKVWGFFFCIFFCYKYQSVQMTTIQIPCMPFSWITDQKKRTTAFPIWTWQLYAVLFQSLSIKTTEVKNKPKEQLWTVFIFVNPYQKPLDSWEKAFWTTHAAETSRQLFRHPMVKASIPRWSKQMHLIFLSLLSFYGQQFKTLRKLFLRNPESCFCKPDPESRPECRTASATGLPRAEPAPAHIHHSEWLPILSSSPFIPTLSSHWTIKSHKTQFKI